VRIIDRYVIREVLLPLLIGLLVFTFILIIPFLIQYAETFIAKGVPFSVVLRIMATLLPQALALAIPAALLVGLLVAFGRLSADREFVAMQACGIGLMRLLRPVVVVSILGWAATSYVMLVALPNANQTFNEITFSIVAGRAEGEVKPRTFFLGFPDLALYVREVPVAGGWNDVFMADNRGGQTPAVYFARHGRVLLDSKKRTVEMLLEQGARHTADPDGKYEVFRFNRLVLSVNPESVFPRKGPQKGENEMTIAELRERAAAIQATGESPHNQLMAIHRKFSIPVACLVFGLIGLALGATNRRDGKMGSFVFGLAVIFMYYIPLFLGPAMAKGHLMPPWLAVWFPNVLLGGVGCIMLIRRARAADQPITLSIPRGMRRLFARERSDASNAAPASRRQAIATPRGRGVASILDRYVTASYVRVFGISTLGLAGLFYISTFLDLSDKVFKGQATWAMLGQYFWFITPQYAYYVLPMAVLLATLVTIGLLTKNSELVVMKACGISLYRVAVPMLAGALVAGSILFVLDQSILGPANRKAEAIRHVMRGGSLQTFDVLNRQWMVGSRGEIYHYNYFDPSAHQLLGLEVYEFIPGQQTLMRRTSVDRAVYSPDDTWKVDRGWQRRFDADGNTTAFAPLADVALALEPAASFATQQPDPKFMSYTQLRGYIAGLESSGFDVSEQQVALERKLSFPFVTLIMTLIAVPFAVTTGRRGAMYGIGIGIVLAISYWVAISVFGALGSGGVVAPLVAAWAPNCLFGAGAAYLLLTVRT
jgi:LPS export ABC transporter permease LptG/LPS export ABC transporter permease LptF